jgi:hypothetical protein
MECIFSDAKAGLIQKEFFKTKGNLSYRLKRHHPIAGRADTGPTINSSIFLTGCSSTRLCRVIVAFVFVRCLASKPNTYELPHRTT